MSQVLDFAKKQCDARVFDLPLCGARYELLAPRGDCETETIDGIVEQQIDLVGARHSKAGHAGIGAAPPSPRVAGAECSSAKPDAAISEWQPQIRIGPERGLRHRIQSRPLMHLVARLRDYVRSGKPRISRPGLLHFAIAPAEVWAMFAFPPRLGSSAALFLGDRHAQDRRRV